MLEGFLQSTVAWKTHKSTEQWMWWKESRNKPEWWKMSKRTRITVSISTRISCHILLYTRRCHQPCQLPFSCQQRCGTPWATDVLKPWEMRIYSGRSIKAVCKLYYFPFISSWKEKEGGEREAEFPQGRLTKTEMKEAPDEKVMAGSGWCVTGRRSRLIAEEHSVGGRRYCGSLWSGSSGDYE